MPEDTDIEKLAGVLNSTGQGGKDSFVRMLWKNQSVEVRNQLMPLLNAETRQALGHSPDESEPSPPDA
jgi:hypothetical protein